MINHTEQHRLWCTLQQIVPFLCRVYIFGVISKNAVLHKTPECNHDQFLQKTDPFSPFMPDCRWQQNNLR